MVASFQSISLPFIQIFPVPGNAITPSRSIVALLRLAAEWATVGTRVQRLAAVPAEARLRRLARFEAALDLVRGVDRAGRFGLERRTGGAPRAAAPCGEHVVEQFVRSLVALVDLR